MQRCNFEHCRCASYKRIYSLAKNEKFGNMFLKNLLIKPAKSHSIL